MDDIFKQLQAEHEKYRQSNHKWKLKHRYGVTPVEYNAMLLAQSGACAGCKTEGDYLCVDHCHITKRVRGLLCRECNLAIRYSKDNPETLRKLALYLEQAK